MRSIREAYVSLQTLNHHVPNPTHSREVTLTFVVVPVGRNQKFGFWLQAGNPQEARRLVSLNVPGMAGVTNADLAQCTPDDTHSPMHGLIFEGSGRSYTITRRSS